MENKIYLHGTIGESITADSFLHQLNYIQGDITVDISSNGGSVHQGTTIYNALIAYKGNVTIEITGWALSIASLIAMAGDNITMAETAVMMVHKPWTEVGGNADALRKEANVLDTAQEALVAAYVRKTGQSKKEIHKLLNNETWLTAEEAFQLGFIDSIINSEPSKMVASFDLTDFKNIPSWVKTMQNKQKKQTDQDTDIQNQEMVAKIELKRVQDITALFEVTEKYGSSEINKIISNAINDSSYTKEMVNKQILDQMGKESPGPVGSHRMSWGDEKATKDNFIDAARDALLMRNGVKVVKPHPAAQDIRNMGVPEIARNILRMNNDYNASSYSNSEAVIKASHTTGDFPILLANIGTKSLLEGYEAAPITCREWTAEREVADFKDQTLARLSEAPEMLEVAEGGEYKHGTFGEAADTFSIKKWGRIFTITRESLINDDLSAFTRLPAAFGQRAASLESDEVYSLLTSTGNLADGSPLFHGSRGNLAGAGASLSVSSLGAARADMRKQKGLDGKTVIDIQPRFLIVPVELETEGEQILSTLVDPSKSNDTVNPAWIRSLTLISDPRLTGSGWYLSASPSQVEGIIRAFLAGMPRPYTEEKTGFEIDDFSIKARLEFAAAIIDPKGLYKNPGV